MPQFRLSIRTSLGGRAPQAGATGMFAKYRSREGDGELDEA